MSAALDIEGFKQQIKAISFKHKATPLSAFCGSFLLLGGLYLFETDLRALGDDSALLFVGSFGALATIIFAAPAAPLGIPYNTLLGHTLSVSIALLVHWTELATGISLLARVLSPSLAIGAMLACGVTNPPAAAIVVIFTTSPKALGQWGYGALYLLMPALLGCAYAFVVQAGIAHVMNIGLPCFAEAEDSSAGPPKPEEAAKTAPAADKLTSAAAEEATPARSASPAAKNGTPAPTTVEVRCVDPTTALAIASAVEGAAYKPDPLTYMIDELVNERKVRAKKGVAASKLQAMMRGRSSRKHSSAKTAISMV